MVADESHIAQADARFRQFMHGNLDWELWGRGPAGTDAATLLCYSLLAPRTVNRIRATFADVLDTPSGRTAQLVAAARLLSRAANGDHPELVPPLLRHIRGLTGREWR